MLSSRMLSSRSRLICLTRSGASSSASTSAAFSSSTSSSSSSSSSSPAGSSSSSSSPAGSTLTPAAKSELVHRPSTAIATHADAQSMPLDVVSSPFGAASGAPEEFVHRHVRIYRPSRSATQQNNRGSWRVEFDTTKKWLNPLMGWSSSRDTASQLRNALVFDTKEQAIEFAKKQGFQWEVLKDHNERTFRKSYADNFKWKGFPKDKSA